MVPTAVGVLDSLSCIWFI